jgi:hypothetical protein
MRSLAVLVVIAASLVACKKPEAPKAAQAPGAQAAVPAKSALQGKILEKKEAQTYSYLQLQTASGEVWAAVPATQRAVGTDAVIENAFPMKDFESQTLNRKFDVVYFGTLQGEGGAPMGAAPAAEEHGPGDGHDHGPAQAMPTGMGGGAMGGGAMGGGANAPIPPGQLAEQHKKVAGGPADAKVEKVSKATGADGRTVAEVWAQKASLKDKNVAIRGQVVKYSPNIMGKNWIHVRDGSGNAEKNDHDLTVTTVDETKVGDVVTVKGLVRVDKDFGAGYAYPVIVEDAKLTQ